MTETRPTFSSETSVDSKQWITAARSGDPDAFGELCRPHEARLLRQAIILCRDPATAEDLAQETLFLAWRKIGSYDGRCLFFTWLCGILLNLHRNQARKGQPMPLSTLEEETRAKADWLLANAAEPGPTNDEILQQTERAVALRRCLEQLPAKQRTVIELRFYSGESLEGIASASGCSIGTVKSRLFNALRKLMQMRDVRRLFQPKEPS